MKVVFAADDQSATVDAVIDAIKRNGHELEVIPVSNWPDIARTVGEMIAGGKADSGVLMCWTGTGTSIMANKVRGVRAALCWDPWIAEGARRWNDANVLVMSLKKVSPDVASEIVDMWFSISKPDDDEIENINKIGDYEDGS